MSLVDDSLALEVAFLGIGDGFLRALGRVGHSILSLRVNSIVGFSNNPVGLIPELRGKLAVSFHNLGWVRISFLSRVLWAAICAASGPLKPLLAIACSICWRRDWKRPDTPANTL